MNTIKFVIMLAVLSVSLIGCVKRYTYIVLPDNQLTREEILLHKQMIEKLDHINK